MIALLFKAESLGLFDTPVTVTGHTRGGTYVAPYRATRKKAPAQPTAGDLFAAPKPAPPPKPAPKPEPKPAPKPEPKPEPGNLDPTSATYRYRDTGYIAGSRKEEAAEMIRRAGRSGQRVTFQDVDWAEIEKNPREAKDLITKSNLFGSVDWATLRDNGLEPGAGFLIDRVYASIGKEPSEDTPTARKDYALGLQTLRDRLERCKTASDVTTVIKDIEREFSGTFLTAEQADTLLPLTTALDASYQAKRDWQKQHDEISNIAHRADGDLSSKEWEQQKRINRKWKPDPKLDEEIAQLKIIRDNAWQRFNEWLDKHPEGNELSVRTEKADGRTTYEFRSPIGDTIRAQRDKIERLKTTYKVANMLANPLLRAWATLGQRFINVINYRHYKGSDAFQDHVAAVKANKVTDWSWAETEGKTLSPKATKQETGFVLKVAERYERKGGRAVTVDSTAALKEMFSLRDVQSGNWVLEDPTSARWHVQQACEAFCDLADLFGIPETQVSFKGRLALAFGARGKGNAGFRGAPRAHYEGVHRVINITKMGGGGTLAHEWFHALDNLLTEAETGTPTDSQYFATEGDKLGGELGTAIRNLVVTLTEGPHQIAQDFTYTARDIKLAELNLRPRPGGYGTPGVVTDILGSANADEATAKLEQRLGNKTDRRSQKNLADWRQILIAHFGGNPEGGTLRIHAGPKRSRFATAAVLLDHGAAGKYWSTTRELAARAFQSYVEDRLAEKGRQSDYLSAMANNRYYLGDKPFPEGDERQRINLAFDRLFTAILKSGTLEKALQLLFKKATS